MVAALIGHGSMAVILAAVIGGCAFALIASLVMNWASGKSALWNIGFAVAVVTAGAGLLVLLVMFAMEHVPR
jgi:hypothetical protein